MIGGEWRPGAANEGFRAHSPRFSAENAATNKAVSDRLGKLARGFGLTAGQLAIAWVVSQGSDIVPLIGTRKSSRLDDAIAVLSGKLGPEDLAKVESAIPPDAIAGQRYAPAQMRMLDSER